MDYDFPMNIPWEYLTIEQTIERFGTPEQVEELRKMRAEKLEAALNSSPRRAFQSTPKRRS